MDSILYFTDSLLLAAKSIEIEIAETGTLIQALSIGLATIRMPKNASTSRKQTSFSFTLDEVEARKLLNRIQVKRAISREAEDYLAA